MKQPTSNGLYIGVGALWGGMDIQRMADRGTLKVVAFLTCPKLDKFHFQGLKITMKKHPSMLKVEGELLEKLKEVKDLPLTLYEGTFY